MKAKERSPGSGCRLGVSLVASQRDLCREARIDSRVLEEGKITPVLPETPLTCLDTPNTSKPVAFGQDGSREMLTHVLISRVLPAGRRDGTPALRAVPSSGFTCRALKTTGREPLVKVLLPSVGLERQHSGGRGTAALAAGFCQPQLQSKAGFSYQQAELSCQAPKGSSGGAHPASALPGAAQHHHHCCWRQRGAESSAGQKPARNRRGTGPPRHCSGPGSPHRRPAGSSGPRCWSRRSVGWAWGAGSPICSSRGGRPPQTPGWSAGFLEAQNKGLGHLGSTGKHPLSALGQCLYSGSHPLMGSIFPAPSGQPGPGSLPSVMTMTHICF